MSYRLDVTCPACPAGTPLTHVTNGVAGLETRAVVRCDRCDRTYVVHVQLHACPHDGARAANGTRHPCGTQQAYAAHLRRGEPTDPQCREAHRVYVASRTPPGHRGKKPRTSQPALDLTETT